MKILIARGIIRVIFPRIYRGFPSSILFCKITRCRRPPKFSVNPPALGRLIPHPATASRSIGSLTRKKKRGNGGGGREGGEATRAKRTEEKVSEKSVLGRDIKSSSTGVTRRDPLLSAKALPSPPLPSPSSPLPLPPSFLPPRLPHPGLPRENPAPFVKGDPTKSPTSHTCVQKGWTDGAPGKGGGERCPAVGGWVAGDHEVDERCAFTHALLALYIAGYRRKSPKGKYAKQRPSPSLPLSLPLRLLRIVRACRFSSRALARLTHLCLFHPPPFPLRPLPLVYIFFILNFVKVRLLLLLPFLICFR